MKITVDKALIEQAIDALEIGDQFNPGLARVALRASLDEPVVDSGCSPAVADAYERIDRFLRKNLSDDAYAEYSFDLDIISSLLTPPAEHLCKWPTCQTEKYQQDLADQLAREVIGTPPAEVPMLSDEEIAQAWSVGEHNASAATKRRITRAIEDVYRRKAGL